MNNFPLALAKEYSKFIAAKDIAKSTKKILQKSKNLAKNDFSTKNTNREK